MNIKNYFQIGDIVVESRDNTPIGKYIIVDVERKVNNKLTFSLYVLLSPGPNKVFDIILNRNP